MGEIQTRTVSRRWLLATSAALSLVAAGDRSLARTISGQLPWSPFAGEPPRPVNPLGWYFFTSRRSRRRRGHRRPADPCRSSVAGRQGLRLRRLHRSPAGRRFRPGGAALYQGARLQPGFPTQGYQGDLTPAGRYRLGLRALDDYTHRPLQKGFRAADAGAAGRGAGRAGRRQDHAEAEAGFQHASEFFELVLQNTMEGFFADPLYGGNKDMASWKMIGFPGARYDYRDYIDKHNHALSAWPGFHLRGGGLSMAKLLPKKDAVIIGLGWTGAILAQQLTEAGLNVVAIERGPWRDTATDFNIGYMQDELRYAIRKDLFLQPARRSHDHAQRLSPDGAADARLWLASCRAMAWAAPACTGTAIPGASGTATFAIKSHLTQRYGAKKIDGPDVAGLGRRPGTRSSTASTSSNISAAFRARPAIIKGQIQPGGNPFESPRSREYPNPPMKMSYAPTLFAQDGGAAWAITRFPRRPPTCREPYVNPLGVAMGQCTYCGFCERFGCGNYSKASAQTTILPVLMKKPNFEAAHRMRGAEDQPDARRQACAKSVTYLDAQRHGI